MQKVAAYLLERRDGMSAVDARNAELRELRDAATRWLSGKGASAIEQTGTYSPEDGSTGTYTVEEAIDKDRLCWTIRLQEETNHGRLFAVGVSLISVSDRVAVYVSMETGWSKTHIMPVVVDSRCPRIVRDLLSRSGNWYHGASIIHDRRTISGFEAGEALAEEIQRPDRTVPVLVTSTNRGSVTLPDLDEKLAYDLAGLASVVVVDEDASWALTDVLGAEFACYWGAVRLYWPHFERSQDRYVHPLWTADRLLESGRDAIRQRERFRNQLRNLIFQASALSVAQPLEINEIRDARGRATVDELRIRASSSGEYRELAESYAAENDQLRQERSGLRNRVRELEESVSRLEADRRALQMHLDASKSGRDASSETSLIAPSGGDEEDEHVPPSSGETRFYKKVHAAKSHDIMIRVQDCGCNKWESSHPADKARKGIIKLEKGRSDWKSMQHCASCTGGGVWRVRW